MPKSRPIYQPVKVSARFEAMTKDGSVLVITLETEGGDYVVREFVDNQIAGDPARMTSSTQAIQFFSFLTSTRPTMGD